MIEDPKTPNTHESQPFRLSLMQCVQQQTLQRTKPRSAFHNWFGEWYPKMIECAEQKNCSHIVLKHPLAGFFIPEISEVCNPKYLLVTRPMKAIKKTRIRRNWPLFLGEGGAPKIYVQTLAELLNAGKSALMLSYPEFLASTTARAEMRQFLNLPNSGDKMEAAEDWLRR
jgi:hypothetical protein